MLDRREWRVDCGDEVVGFQNQGFTSKSRINKETNLMQNQIAATIVILCISFSEMTSLEFVVEI